MILQGAHLVGFQLGLRRPVEPKMPSMRSLSAKSPTAAGTVGTVVRSAGPRNLVMLRTTKAVRLLTTY